MKRDVWTFLTLLSLLSGVFYAAVLLLPDAPKQWNSRWGWGRSRFILIAYGLAIASCLPPYLVVWWAFDAYDGSQLALTFAKAGLPSVLRGPLGMLPVVLIVLPLTSLISAAGEEIGWRGFLVPRMQALVGFSGTSLLVGLIWAAWHYPINIAVYPLYRPNVPLWYSNACFTLLVIGASFMHTWLRLRSNSLWPSVLLHAAGNSFQGVLQAATRETRVTSYLTTEYGASFAVVGCLLAFTFWRKRREIGG